MIGKEMSVDTPNCLITNGRQRKREDCNVFFRSFAQDVICFCLDQKKNLSGQ